MMAKPIVMPKQGNQVESCLILQWLKQPGDAVEVGEPVCEIETDKAVVEIPSPEAGVLLETFYPAGEEVPVFTPIAAVGDPGDDLSDLRPEAGDGVAPSRSEDSGSAAGPAPAEQNDPEDSAASQIEPPVSKESGERRVFASPRARKLAQKKDVDLQSLKGSGPAGRIIERDVRAALTQRGAAPAISPVARAMLETGDFESPPRGTGPRGRVFSGDLIPRADGPEAAGEPPAPDPGAKALPLTGTRRTIACRMLASVQSTAQLTLNASADARALRAYRERLKASPEELGLADITINDLLLLVVSRVLPRFPELNALLVEEVIHQHQEVHLGIAVDTPRGLVVPVLRSAHKKSLKEIAEEARRLARASVEGRIEPEKLTGGTFTVSNLGGLGVESFTPILNPPQVGILGVGNINLKPVETRGEVIFIPHIGLSLTINHQAVDGAPAARFLRALAQGIANLELMLAG